MRISRNVITTLGIVVLVAMTGCVSSSAQHRDRSVVVIKKGENRDGYLRIARRPPAPKVEARAKRPTRRHVWQEGHWRWGGSRYLWVTGQWVVPPRGYSKWVPGYWKSQRRGWVFVAGYWR